MALDLSQTTLDDPKKAKLRQRIKLEIEQQQDLDHLAKVKLVELLHELDNTHTDRLLNKNRRRMQIHDAVTNSNLAREEKLLSDFEKRDQQLKEKKASLEQARKDRQNAANDLHNKRLTKALETKKQQERDAFNALKRREQQRDQKLKDMEERKRQEKLRRQREMEEREERRDRLLQDLEYRKTERDAMLDVRAYEKDIAMELANARRAQQRSQRMDELDEKRKHNLIQSNNVVIVMQDKAKEAEQHRAHRLAELAKDRKDKYHRMAVAHAEREHRNVTRKDELFAEKERKRLEELERERQREQAIADKKKRLEAERWEASKQLERERRNKKQRAEDMIDERIARAELKESVRRKGRTRRFFEQLGLNLKGEDYVVEEDSPVLDKYN
eukprot:TRINITY_DN18811_c0_g1_i1.p1 TRINITY_DN18811_c0_g1~~TRINITY_DN18811_c0_g1_i1.p1  ORF type:complete len:387 (+),score=63.02 TRINITY_DN18811_c0_g1_i1:76-1236(+)